MLQGVKTFKVSTKADKNAAEVETVLSIDLNGCSEDVAVALAIQALVVKWQGHARKHGIPEKATVKMADMAPGKRLSAAPMTPEEVLAGVARGEYKAADLIAKLQEMQAARQ